MVRFGKTTAINSLLFSAGIIRNARGQTSSASCSVADSGVSVVSTTYPTVEGCYQVSDYVSLDRSVYISYSEQIPNGATLAILGSLVSVSAVLGYGRKYCKYSMRLLASDAMLTLLCHCCCRPWS